MGRPPIGKIAMTDAERMRRYRAKHPVTKPVTKPSAADTADSALKQELATAKARIRELEAELARKPSAATRKGHKSNGVVADINSIHSEVVTFTDEFTRRFTVWRKGAVIGDEGKATLLRVFYLCAEEFGRLARELLEAESKGGEAQTKAKPKAAQRKPTPEEIEARVAKAAKTRAAAKARKAAREAAEVAHRKMLKVRARKIAGLEAKANDPAVTPAERDAFAAKAAELKARQPGQPDYGYDAPIVPRTVAEMDELKRKVMEERAAKRAAKTQ